MKILKMIGIAFCGLMILAGAINTISPSHPDDRAENLVLTLIFLVFIVLLIRSIRKHEKNRRERISESPPIPCTQYPATQISAQPSVPAQCPAPAIAQSTQEHSAFQIVLSDMFQRIPEEIINLLWFINGPFKNYSPQSNTWTFNLGSASITYQSVTISEPSSIDISLSVYNQLVDCPPLDYYPSYADLSPKQKAVYLHWLSDITAPIDIGYVFIFYYGLERHLFFGNAEAALKTILVLRQFHGNNSFLAYSGDAIMLYSLLHNRPDIIPMIENAQISTNLCLFSSCMLRHSLSAADIMSAHKAFSFENNRYIKGQPDLFLSTLKSLLSARYGAEEYPIELDDLQAANGTFTLALANYSLLPTQRFLSLPDISTSARAHREINSLLSETHESVKIQLREIRKKAKEQ